MLRQRHIRYVYIGQQQGSVNYSGLGRLNPYDILNSNDFRLLYHRDRVWIFELVK